ncbi:MAG: glutamate racemase [Candidatus Moranbacteria bacterium]|nr:glutamate racemase [Candidatus Moranbacteria bacterium]
MKKVRMIKPAGKIGVFDSGLGGLAVLREVTELMPEYEYLYLGDNLRAPYGDKSQEQIFRHTLSGVRWLFDNGAEITILACNTASANALRKIQREILPLEYPDKRVLGIIIPTVESMESFSSSGHVGILATEATVASEVFETEMEKHNPGMRTVCQSGGMLVDLIERDRDLKMLIAEIENVIGKLLDRDGLIDAVILGCTHYALIAGQIERILPKNIKVIEQGGIVAAKLADYIDRHYEIRRILKNKFSVSFHTTSGSENVKKLMARFYGADIQVSTVEYEVL